ncbi:transporter [Rhizobium sp. KVB221]|uniref:Transporter n=1 Tax=Rhizobium setariae TaxID=2801340 RepID=A0A936YRD6_9HYPH|nr:transporter [Rhizobium setariae]MBL0373367.1 transporter [Rhizobium setariae]
MSRFGNSTLVVALALSAFASIPASADEGGVAFWVPGINGSFAAVPGEPGWSWVTVYYHTSVSAGGDIEFPSGGDVQLGIRGRGDLAMFGPSYTFEETYLGGQLSVSLLGVAGRNQASVDATLTGPNGNLISGSRTEALTSIGDVVPQVTMKWNDSVNNYMTYVTGDIPVGDYNPDRLANLGLGHGAVDAGLGYTYLNPATGREFSIVGGMTYNFENPDTDYKNGIDGHIDWAASQFLNEQWHVGVVGYAFQQLTGDSGNGATLGDFKSRVFGIGPQVGYKFPVSEAAAGYVNLKGYYEFGAKNRPEGWNMWLTLAFSPAVPKAVGQ